MKITKKEIVICFITFLGTLFLSWLFLIVSAKIPNEKIQENMLKSALTYAQEDAFSFCDGNRLNGVADNYADSIWLNTAWYMGKGNPIFSSLNTQYFDGGEYGENIGLYLAVSEEGIQPNTDYTRYWHGTAGFIRILHLFTDVNGVKAIGFMVTMILAAVVVLILIRDKHNLLAASFVLSLCLVKVWNIRFCMEYQPAFILAFILCILYLLFEKKGDWYLLLFSTVGGALIAFFDFLTTETMTILLPLIFVVTIRARRNVNISFAENMYFITSQVVAWASAYAMCFLTKWSLTSILTGENKFSSAIQSAENRVSGALSDGTKMSGWKQVFAAPIANISILFGAQDRIDMTLFVVGVFLIVGLSVLGVFLFFADKKDKTPLYSLLILGSIIIVRYMVLSNHSYMHAFFTYRGLINLFMAIFSIYILKLQSGKS